MKKWVGTILIFLPIFVNAQIVTTFAGNGLAAYSGNDVPATVAGIPDPIAGVFDKYGNYYFADGLNSNRIRKINTAGIITTIAGNGIGAYGGDNGPATSAELSSPNTVKLDTFGNLYICDGANFRIRKIDVMTGIITTVAGTGTGSFGGDGGPATAADIYDPQDICIDKMGNIYIADLWNNRIRKVNTSGIINTIAGGGISGVGDNGPATAAQLVSPYGVVVDDTGNVYIAENSSSTVSNRVRKVNTLGIITTIAGSGNAYFGGDGIPATASSISPMRIVFDALGQLYISDWVNLRVYKIDYGGILHLVAGNGTAGGTGDGGPATAAEFNYPIGIAFDGCGNLYLPEPGNHDIRKINFDTTGVPYITIAGNDTVCAGTTVSYDATVTNGSAISYLWYVNGIVMSTTSSTYTYMPSNGDSMRCLLTGVSQCSGDTVTVNSNTIYMTVTPIATPTISLTSGASAAIGSTVTVNANISGAGSSYNINWYDNGALFSTTTAPVVTYTKGAGTDNITATVIPSPIGMLPGCYDSSTSAAFTITVSNNGVNNVAEPRIYVYPNPASTILNINNVTTQEPYSLLSIVGSTLQNGVLQPGNNTISIEGLAAGIYMLEVTSEAGEKTITKIAKQ